MKRLTSIEQLQHFQKAILESRDPGRLRVRICMTGCRAFGAVELRDAFKASLAEKGLTDTVDIVETGCHGFCARAPVSAIDPYGFFYQQISPKDVPLIVEESIMGGKPVEKLLYKDPKSDAPVALEKNVPFYREQMKIVLRNCGQIDPTSMEDYVARDGYRAIAKVLSSMTPENVIEEITRSGLRGRGGAGFSTGTKWRFARNSKGDMKYVICNADEGDPGAFMDRAVLEGDPHTVIEGMLIAAYAIGAKEGYIYVRAEYPIAVTHIKKAVADARAAGLLGEHILGCDFSFDIRIKEGAGAFVCGEETALMASIEGRRGMPRTRPPFPAVSGLWGKPTNINNVETYANIAPIIDRGQPGTPRSARRRAKAPRSSLLPGRSTTPASWRCPWASPWSGSSSTSAAAYRGERSSRQPRRAALQAAASPPPLRTSLSITIPSLLRGPSWGRAAS